MTTDTHAILSAYLAAVSEAYASGKATEHSHVPSTASSSFRSTSIPGTAARWPAAGAGRTWTRTAHIQGFKPNGHMDADSPDAEYTRLVGELGTPVFLIVDNLKVHHANGLQRWLGKARKIVRLFYLPSYSPELNPDEYVNRDTKAHVAERNIANDVDGMEREVGGHLSERKANPEFARKLLRKKEVAYVLEEC